MSGTKKEVKRVARGMNPITRKPRTYDPLPRAVSFPCGLCLPFAACRHRSLFIPWLFSFFFLAPRAGQRQRAGSIRLLSPAFSSCFFSSLPLFFAFPFSFSSSFSPIAPFPHRFRPSRFSCILTRLHAHGFAVRPDYPTPSSIRSSLWLPQCQAPSLFLHGPAQFLSHTCPFFFLPSVCNRVRSSPPPPSLAPALRLSFPLCSSRGARSVSVPPVVISPFHHLPRTARPAESRAFNRRSYFSVSWPASHHVGGATNSATLQLPQGRVSSARF